MPGTECYMVLIADASAHRLPVDGAQDMLGASQGGGPAEAGRVREGVAARFGTK